MSDTIPAMQKMSPDAIKRHVNYFINNINATDKRSQRRAIASGAYLYRLRDVLGERLERGWDYLNTSPDDVDAADLWFDLLSLYEQISNVLDDHGKKIDRVDVAKQIFDGWVDDEQGVKSGPGKAGQGNGA